MYQSFIGLEIHIRLLTRTKVFCGCRTVFGEEPNTNVCPVCLGYPGTLPALNREAVEMGYLVARTLNCSLAEKTYFDRKNYFYPDMPKNYQITQFHAPLGQNGFLELELGGKRKRIGIHDVHLEEDAGKMIHERRHSFLDYNRAGTSLLEIVTEPDLENGSEAEQFIQEFRSIVRYLGVCDGNMEEGSLKCDANVSINIRGAGLGVKTEVKNLNSSRFVRKALTFEINRQRKVLESGGLILQETRLWDDSKGTTEPMRSKESAHDYRYFPEPDLPVFRTDQRFLDRIESRLTELPGSRRVRFMEEYGLSEEHAVFLCDDKETADFFEKTVGLGAGPGTAAAWLGADIQRILKRDSLTLGESPMTPERLAELSGLLETNRINSKIAKQTAELVFSEDLGPEEIIRRQGWEQISDTGAVEKLVDTVISEQKKAAEQIRSGDLKPTGFLVGQVMKLSAGKADPQLAKELILRKLSTKSNNN